MLITDTTTITGVTPQVGLLAEVKGTQVGPRTVRATEIEVTADTVIDTQHGEVKIGALVCVTVVPEEDGTLVARRITVFESG